MKRLAALLALMATQSLAEEAALAETMALVPPPTLSALRAGTYEVDKTAMTRAIEAQLAGVSSREIMALLRAEEIEHRIVSEDLIAVIPRKVFLPVLASYACLVDLAFEDGHFARVADISGCGLIPP